MCGIAGFFTKEPELNQKDLENRVLTMANTLIHRGPDQGGAWADEGCGVAMGARRLAVIEPGKSANQPVISKNGRWILVYNGEVYNFQTLRRELGVKGHVFSGHGDTEVVVEAIDEWGVDGAVKRFNGMFAFAVWDKKDQKLYLARDHLGVKPLYWGYLDGLFLFGSELKALCAYPGLPRKLNRDAVAEYFRFGYIPAPMTVYEDINKLLPGHYLSISANREPSLEPYWSFHDAAHSALSEPYNASEKELVDDLDIMLHDVIKGRTVADVPIGSFLSGGIDSSLVTAILSDISPSPVNTFTIGFKDQAYDESEHAGTVARHLGTNHTCMMIENSQIAELVPQLSNWYDEPFADSSQIPTALVSQLARKSVTVALSGDGGDELFGGYDRYLWADGPWRRYERIPRDLRRIIGKMALGIGKESWDSLIRILPHSIRPAHGGESIRWLAKALKTESPEILYRHLVSISDQLPTIQQEHAGRSTPLWASNHLGMFSDPPDNLQMHDSFYYLPDDILTKLDRASMAFSLEAREPLLDQRLLDFAWRLPRKYKIASGKGKVMLRSILGRYLPEPIVNRPKKGFSVPIDTWLRGPLKEWADSVFSDASHSQSNLLDLQEAKNLWLRFQNEETVSGQVIWRLLMFEQWRHKWLE